MCLRYLSFYTVQSKLAMQMITAELAHRLGTRQPSVICLDPGLVLTKVKLGFAGDIKIEAKWSALYTVCGVLYTVYGVLCIYCCVLCGVWCVLCTVYYVFIAVYCVVCTVYGVLCIYCCVLCTVYCIPVFQYCVLCAWFRHQHRNVQADSDKFSIRRPFKILI
jgi:hypothetical protein